MEVINAVGRRKSAIARVYLSQGTGNVTVNGKDFKEYFPIDTLQYIVMQPFGVLSLNGKFDVKATIDGGGVKGQAEAVRLGITRALMKLDEENRKPLKAA